MTIQTLSPSQISSVKSAANFAAAGFGTYSDIVTALAAILELPADETAQILADEIADR